MGNGDRQDKHVETPPANLNGAALLNAINDRATDHDITVIIPAYNEEARLPWTLRGLAEYLDAWNVDYRVLVANDGSTDRTAALAEGFGPRFSTLTLAPQGGKGRAVRTAMLQASGRIVAFTDADLPFDLAALRTGYEWVDAGQCDVVFARAISWALRAL